MKNRFLTLLYHLVLVPKCASCRKRLDPIIQADHLNHGKICLCSNCLEEWQHAKSQMCHVCYMSADKCFCMPKAKTFDQPYIPSLFFYHPDVKRPANKVLYTAKRHNVPELFDFLSIELEPNVRSLLKDLGVPEKDCILSWIPRGKRSIRQHGVDQAYELCRCLSVRLDCAQMQPLLVRSKRGQEQKHLDKRERQKKIDRSIALNKSYATESVLKGKTVIIVDDIVTTGATMKRAISLISSAGAERVLTCCVARSEIKGKKQP